MFNHLNIHIFQLTTPVQFCWEPFGVPHCLIRLSTLNQRKISGGIHATPPRRRGCRWPTHIRSEARRRCRRTLPRLSPPTDGHTSTEHPNVSVPFVPEVTQFLSQLQASRASHHAAARSLGFFFQDATTALTDFNHRVADSEQRSGAELSGLGGFASAGDHEQAGAR